MAIYPSTGRYDIALSGSGSGWQGTFANIIRQTAKDILDDGPYGPVEVMFDDEDDSSTLVDGTLRASDETWLIIATDEATVHVEIENVRRFRA